MVRLSPLAEAIRRGETITPIIPERLMSISPATPQPVHFPTPPPRKRQTRPTTELERLQDYQRAGVTDLGLKIPLNLGILGVHTIGVSATPEDIFEKKPPTFTGFELFQPKPPKAGAIDILATPPPFTGDIVAGADVEPEFFKEKEKEYYTTIIEKYGSMGIPAIQMPEWPEFPDIFGGLKELGKYALIGGAILIGAMIFMKGKK